jgi:hypothetical protein
MFMVVCSSNGGIHGIFFACTLHIAQRWFRLVALRDLNATTQSTSEPTSSPSAAAAAAAAAVLLLCRHCQMKESCCSSLLIATYAWAMHSGQAGRPAAAAAVAAAVAPATHL